MRPPPHFFFDPPRQVSGVIEGRRDIGSARAVGDARSAEGSLSLRFFTSVDYSADGRCILAGGGSKRVCLYDLAHLSLIRRFTITNNASLDGVKYKLNSADMTDAGNIKLIDHDASLLPPPLLTRSEKRRKSAVKKGVVPRF